MKNSPLILILAVILALILVPGVLAQEDFCPAADAADASMACYECYQTRTCDQDERCIRAQCCLARCHPACGGRTGPECSAYSCACEGGGGTDGGGGDGGDSTWIVIVGALVVIGGGLAIGAKKLAGPKDKKEKKKEKEKVRYILQLSTNKVRISPDTPAAVTVTAWKQVGDSAPVPAPEASIQFVPPSDAQELSIVPSNGTGSLESMFSVRKDAGQKGKAGPRSMKVTVVASAGGTGTKAEIDVELTGVYR